MSKMLTADQSKIIDDVVGKEMRGKLNEYLIMHQLLDKSDTDPSTDGDGQNGITTRSLADTLDLPQSTTATVVKRLSREGFVTHSKGMPVKLTSKGQLFAKEQIKHHHLLEILFTEVLELAPHEAHKEAIRLMLVASCDLIQKIDDVFDHPSTCPRGHHIPTADLCTH